MDRNGIEEMPTKADRLTALYEEHSRRVRAYCLRRVGDGDADDALAATFAVAWRRINDVPTDDKALPWLYGVARRVVSDHYRSVGRRRRLVERLSGVRPVATPGPEWQVVRGVEYQQVHEALRAMRDKDREILMLVAWEGLSNESIAIVVGCSTPTATQRIHRAKQRLGRTFLALQDGPLNSVADESERS